MLSEAQQSITLSKEAMPEDREFDGPGGLEVSNEEDKFAANYTKALPKPGFDS
jgi:hypothetical protein